SKRRSAAPSALSSTSGVSTRKVASVRARGPAGVSVDSLISQRSRGRRTTYAIVGMLPTILEMLREPGGGQVGRLFEGARLLEEVGGAGHDVEAALTPQLLV